MMAIHLSIELERAAKQSNDSTVLYFFIDRQDKRDTAVHVLRGLLTRLIKVKDELTRHLLDEYDVQKEVLFSKDAIEALWRVFVKMISDPVTGQVYCIIDGLDYCTDESLWRLISRITNFFLYEPQSIVDDCQGQSLHDPSSMERGNAKKRASTMRGAVLKMILVSREKPKWAVEQLSEFPRIDIGVRSRRFAPRSAKKPPTLASVAARIIRQQKYVRAGCIDADQHKASDQGYVEMQSSLSSTYSTNIESPITPYLPAAETNSIAVAARPTVQSLHNLAPDVSSIVTSVPCANGVRITETLNQHGSSSPQAPSKPFERNNRSELLGQEAPVTELDTSFSFSKINRNNYVPAASPTEVPQAFTGPESSAHHEGPPGFGDLKTERNEIVEDIGDPALRLYIEGKLEEYISERQYPTEIQSYIVAALEYRGDDTFLWVDFAIEIIRKTNITDIENVLNSLPPSLTEMYSFILLGISPSLTNLVVGLLRWSVCAREPLTVLELTVSLSLTQYSSDVAKDYVLAAIKACGNMLSVSSDDETVNIVHSSLVDFLSDRLSPIHQNSSLRRFAIPFDQTHGDIANFCLSYLEAGCFNEGSVNQGENGVAYSQRLAQFPFMPYAANFWPYHFRKAGNLYLNVSSPFFQSKSKIRKNWWKTYWGFSTGKSTLVAPLNFTLLHLASYLDLVCIAQHMLQGGDLHERLDKRDSHSNTALEYAVIFGHMDMFQFLIRVGASQKCIDGGTLLEPACQKGQRDIAAALIDMGYDANVRSSTITLKEGVYLMAKWLPGTISDGLDYNREMWSYGFQDRGSQDPVLAQAAMFGHSAVIELLLDRGALVNAGTTKNFTALHAASYLGQTECVQILIKRGATIMAETANRWLAMHFAALRGKLSVIEIFLNMGIRLESATIKLKTALHLAAYGGHTDVVRALIDRGANLELRSHKGETPLHLATRHEKPQVVEVLLSLGASREAITNDGKTPIAMVRKSTSVEGKECLRILQSFGLVGYTPWQPLSNPKMGGKVPRSDASGSIIGHNEGSWRKGPTASVTPTPEPRLHPFHGIQATFTLNGQYQASRLSPENMNGPFQSMNQTTASVQPTGQQFPMTPQPSFHRMQSDPTHGSSRFTFDPRATPVGLPQCRQDDVPPPYAPETAVGTFPMPSGPTKSPTATMPMLTSHQETWQSSPATQIVPSLQIPSNTPASCDSAQTVPRMSRQSAQANMTHVMNSVTFAMPPVRPNPGSEQPVVSNSTSSFHHLNDFVLYASSPNAPNSPLVHSANVPAVSPFHLSSQQPPTQIQYMQQYSPQYSTQPQPPTLHRYQTAPPLQQPQFDRHRQHLPTQQQQFYLHSIPNALSQDLYRTTMPQQQNYPSPNVSSSYLPSNNTASMYNPAHDYSAPPVQQPYNSGTENNRHAMLFAPPPTEAQAVGKRKSFFAGLLR